MKPVGPRARFARAVVTFAAGIACGVVILIPIAELSGWVSASWLRLGFHPACHQITERCLDLGAGPLPICARCAGLYAGGFAGLFITLVGGRRIQLRPRWLVAAAVPSIIDLVFVLAGFSALTNWPRFTAALFPGLVAGLMLADAVCKLAAPNLPAPSEDHVE